MREHLRRFGRQQTYTNPFNSETVINPRSPAASDVAEQPAPGRLFLFLRALAAPIPAFDSHPPLPHHRQSWIVRGRLSIDIVSLLVYLSAVTLNVCVAELFHFRVGSI
jgi:hypothetical protein